MQKPMSFNDVAAVYVKRKFLQDSFLVYEQR